MLAAVEVHRAYCAIFNPCVCVFQNCLLMYKMDVQELKQLNNYKRLEMMIKI